jgi:hypothetical protein
MVPPIERRGNTVPERADEFRGNPASSHAAPFDFNAFMQLQVVRMMTEGNGGNGGNGKGSREIELTDRSLFRVDFRTVIVIVAIAIAWADMRNTLSNLKVAQDAYKDAQTIMQKQITDSQATMQRQNTMMSKEFDDLRLSLVSNGIKIKVNRFNE